MTIIKVLKESVSWLLASLVSLSVLYVFFEERLSDFFLNLRGGIPKGFIIFITGTNGVGKSTISQKVARKLGIKSIVETNDLREVLRSNEDIYGLAKQ